MGELKNSLQDTLNLEMPLGIYCRYVGPGTEYPACSCYFKAWDWLFGENVERGESPVKQPPSMLSPC